MPDEPVQPPPPTPPEQPETKPKHEPLRKRELTKPDLDDKRKRMKPTEGLLTPDDLLKPDDFDLPKKQKEEQKEES